MKGTSNLARCMDDVSHAETFGEYAMEDVCKVGGCMQGICAVIYAASLGLCRGIFRAVHVCKIMRTMRVHLEKRRGYGCIHLL